MMVMARFCWQQNYHTSVVALQLCNEGIIGHTG